MFTKQVLRLWFLDCNSPQISIVMRKISGFHKRIQVVEFFQSLGLNHSCSILTAWQRHLIIRLLRWLAAGLRSTRMGGMLGARACAWAAKAFGYAAGAVGTMTEMLFLSCLDWGTGSGTCVAGCCMGCWIGIAVELRFGTSILTAA